MGRQKVYFTNSKYLPLLATHQVLYKVDGDAVVWSNEGLKLDAQKSMKLYLT